LIEASVDAVVLTSSDQIYDHTSDFIDVCDAVGVPVYSFNIEGVRQGAIAALASDYSLMFEKLIVPKVHQVLEEKVSPGTLPAGFLEESLLFLNLTKAGQLKIEIPESVRKMAHQIY
jgi:ABC-type uncharacterized transport system substrate-binding protein